MRQADKLRVQAMQMYEQGNRHAAMELFQQAHETYQQEDQTAMAAETTINIAVIHNELGNPQAALAWAQSALPILDDAGNPLLYGKALGNLGAIFRSLGQNDKAYRSYREAADTFEAHRAYSLYGETLQAMGYLLIKKGNWIAGATTIGEGLRYRDKLTVKQRVLKAIANLLARLYGEPDRLGPKR